MEAQAFSLAASRFQPVLSACLALAPVIHWGGQFRFGLLRTSPEVNRTMGMWGFSMLGFRQVPRWSFSPGWTDLVQRFPECGAPLCTAGLAFAAYGFHWLAMACRRYIDSSARPGGWRAIALIFLSVLGVDVFPRAGDIPVMLSLSA